MLFSKMASNLGYENKIISGTVSGAGHSWNLIKIEDLIDDFDEYCKQHNERSQP